MPLTEYEYDLAQGVSLHVRHETNERGELESYAVVLVAEEGGGQHTIRVWDNHQGVPHMHRHTKRGGKEPPEKVRGATTTQDGYSMALEDAHRNFAEIVRAWQRS